MATVSAELLPHLAHEAETPGLDEYDLGLRAWIDRMRGPHETDAAFLVRRCSSSASTPRCGDTLRLAGSAPHPAPGAGTPERTTARFPVRAVRYQRAALRRERPKLAVETRRKPRAFARWRRRRTAARRPGARRDGDARARPRRVRERRSARCALGRVRRRPRVRLHRRRAGAAPAARVGVRVPDAQERRADRLRAGECALRIV